MLRTYVAFACKRVRACACKKHASAHVVGYGIYVEITKAIMKLPAQVRHKLAHQRYDQLGDADDAHE